MIPLHQYGVHTRSRGIRRSSNNSNRSNSPHDNDDMKKKAPVEMLAQVQSQCSASRAYSQNSQNTYC